MFQGLSGLPIASTSSFRFLEESSLGPAEQRGQSTAGAGGALKLNKIAEATLCNPKDGDTLRLQEAKSVRINLI